MWTCGAPVITKLVHKKLKILKKILEILLIAHCVQKVTVQVDGGGGGYCVQWILRTGES